LPDSFAVLNVVIADNAVIVEHLRDAYGVECHVIAYSGDHAIVIV
jgi:hypothetical protein